MKLRSSILCAMPVIMALAGCGSSSSTSNAIPTFAPAISATPSSTAGSQAAATIPASTEHWSVSASDPQTWPDACKMATAAEVSAAYPGTYTMTGSVAQILGGSGTTPNDSVCNWSDQNNSKSGSGTVTVMVKVFGIYGSSAEALAGLKAGTSTDAQISGIGNAATFGPIDGLRVQSGNTVWMVSIITGDGNKNQAEATALAQVIAAEFS